MGNCATYADTYRGWTITYGAGEWMARKFDVQIVAPDKVRLLELINARYRSGKDGA